MATKTMILRPVLVDSPDESLISLVPSTTDIGSAHALINEEYADDDSGYIICSAGGQVNSYFDYKRPSDMLNITGVSVKVRCKLESSNTNKVLENSFIVNSTFSATNISPTSDYVDYELSFSESDAMISDMNSIEELRISLASSVSSGAKYSPVRITQIYIEITYDATEAVIYQKIDGVWENLGTVQYYECSNGTWNLLGSENFYDGQNYILQTN